MFWFQALDATEICKLKKICSLFAIFYIRMWLKECKGVTGSVMRLCAMAHLPSGYCIWSSLLTCFLALSVSYRVVISYKDSSACIWSQDGWSASLSGLTLASFNFSCLVKVQYSTELNVVGCLVFSFNFISLVY